jgi:hypothetical protein
MNCLTLRFFDFHLISFHFKFRKKTIFLFDRHILLDKIIYELMTLDYPFEREDLTELMKNYE